MNMVNIIKAEDFTHLFVDQSVVDLMVENSEKGDILDFTDRNIMDSDLGMLADVITENELSVKGLDEDSMVLLESYVRKLNAPVYETLDEFKDMFMAKFPNGSLCIWDRMLDKKLDYNVSRLSLVMVEDVNGNYVRFRLYKSHLVEPKYIAEYGGINAKELYTIENAHITDFANKSIMFRYPKDETEEIIIDLLSNVG